MNAPRDDRRGDEGWPDEAEDRRAPIRAVTRALAVIATVLALPIVGASAYAALLERFTLRAYRPVAATVVETQVLRSDTTSIGADGRPVTISRFIPAVAYEYEVDGDHCVSEVVFPHDAEGDLSWAESVVRRYRKGQPVRAYYDPAEPTNAYLVLRHSARHGPRIAGALAVVVLCWAIDSAMRRRDPIPNAARTPNETHGA